MYKKNKGIPYSRVASQLQHREFNLWELNSSQLFCFLIQAHSSSYIVLYVLPCTFSLQWGKYHLYISTHYSTVLDFKVF